MMPPAMEAHGQSSSGPPSRFILFVSSDGEAPALVERALGDMRPKWAVECLSDPGRARVRAREQPVDAVVVDLLLPEGEGVRLLKDIMEISPTTLRIGLTTAPERQAVQQVGVPVHQLLSKPCDGMVLKAVLARAFAAQDFVAHDAFRALLGAITSLPVLPQIYHELMQELKSDEPSLE